MGPKSSSKASKGSKLATRGSGAAPSCSTALVSGGSPGAAADDLVLQLYKRCMDGKPREKLASLGAADRALKEMQEAKKDQPSRLACLLVVRQKTSPLAQIPQFQHSLSVT